MLQVLSITLPIFLVILLGFAATQFRVTTAPDIRALGAFVVRFALPALIFKSLSQRPFAEIVNPDYLLAYALGSLSVYALMFGLARAVGGASVAASALQALGSSSSNTGFVGYPIAALTLGPPATVALALTIIVENALMIPLALTLAESDGRRSATILGTFLHLAARLARNPMIVAIFCGAVASVSGLQLPLAIVRPIDMLAMTSAPVALFVVGGSLFGLKVAGVMGDVGRIVLGKLVLHPAAVFLAALLVAPALDPNLRKSMLIFACAPTLSILPLLCRPYGQEQIGAAAVMVATVASFLTISLFLLLM